MIISVSLLSTYLYCSRKVFLQKVLQLKEPIKVSTSLGSVRHAFYEQVNKNEEMLVSEITDPSKQFINQHYRKAYLTTLREKIIQFMPDMRTLNIDPVAYFNETWPSIKTEADKRALLVGEFAQETNLTGKELWENLEPKILAELPVTSKELQLRGIIDKIEVFKTKYVPVEIKTGKMPTEGVWPGHRVQLAAYALLLEEKFNTKVNEAYVHYVDSDETRFIAINPFMKDEIKKLVQEVHEIIENNQLPEHCSNQNKCTYCGLKDVCYDQDKMTELLQNHTQKSKISLDQVKQNI